MAVHPDFDIDALYAALEEQRRSRDMTWAAVTREINDAFRDVPGHRPIATSTITGLGNGRRAYEGDTILQELLWLDRTPESFVPGLDGDAAGARLRKLGKKQILRWDTKAIYLALDARRQDRGMTWKEVASEVGWSAGSLRSLSKGGRTGFPHVMRLVRWLGRPAATYTRASDW